MSYIVFTRKLGRGLTVDRQNVVLSLALNERYSIYTRKSTVNIIEKADLATVYYRSSIKKQEKGNK